MRLTKQVEAIRNEKSRGKTPSSQFLSPDLLENLRPEVRNNRMLNLLFAAERAAWFLDRPTILGKPFALPGSLAKQQSYFAAPSADSNRHDNALLQGLCKKTGAGARAQI